MTSQSTSQSTSRTYNFTTSSEMVNIVQSISTSRPGQRFLYGNHNIHDSAFLDVTQTDDINIQPPVIPPWQPNTRLRKLHTQFQKTILYQHPCTPCVYCEKLLYPTKAQWIPYDNHSVYPIEEHYPHIELIMRSKNSQLLISVCNKCKSKPQIITHLPLHPIPQEILAIPIMHRRFLSPVFLHCSLGRTTGANPFSEYRILSGDMRFSKNMRALKLYSGSIGAFLPSQNESEVSWCTNGLQVAAQWLKAHNCYIRPYAEMLTTPQNIPSNLTQPFPTATYSNYTPQNSSANENGIIIQNLNFLPEIHNEDFHYTHLMAGFIKTSNSTTLPLSFNDPELEPLLFPDLFPDGHGHFYEHTQNKSTDNENNLITLTYGKYIKHKLLHVDPRFRLHPYWPLWSYLQLEKKTKPSKYTTHMA